MNEMIRKFLEKIGFQAKKKEIGKISEKNKPADHHMPEAAHLEAPALHVMTQNNVLSSQ